MGVQRLNQSPDQGAHSTRAPRTGQARSPTLYLSQLPRIPHESPTMLPSHPPPYLPPSPLPVSSFPTALDTPPLPTRLPL